jgi:Tfp pilus assembly protein PilO
MASSGALADFSKRPPAFKAGVFAAIAAVLGGLYYQFVYSGLRTDISAAESEKAALISDQKKVKDELVEYKTLLEQDAKLQTIIKENADALPTRAQLPGFFDLLNAQAKAAGVQVRRWDYEKELAVQEVFKVPVEIELAGTYFQIEHFFYLLYQVSQKDAADAEPVDVAPTPPATDPAAPPAPVEPGKAADAAAKLKVEERGRILTIENLVIDEPTMTKDGLILTATFRASTFRQEAKVDEEVDAAKDAKAKKKAAKDAAKDKAKSKNLGDQVKDKTSDAMDKSDDRARGAGGADTDVPETRDDKPEATGVDGVKKGM